MEHQKRRRMQHKVELSTLLRLVVASGKRIESKHTEDNVCRQLAEEAIESVQHNDMSIRAYKLSA